MNYKTQLEKEYNSIAGEMRELRSGKISNTIQGMKTLMEDIGIMQSKLLDQLTIKGNELLKSGVKKEDIEAEIKRLHGQFISEFKPS